MKRFFFRRRQKLTESSTPADPNRTSGLLTGDPQQDRQSIEILLESIAEVTSNNLAIRFARYQLHQKQPQRFHLQHTSFLNSPQILVLFQTQLLGTINNHLFHLQ